MSYSKQDPAIGFLIAVAAVIAVVIGVLSQEPARFDPEEAAHQIGRVLP